MRQLARLGVLVGVGAGGGGQVVFVRCIAGPRWGWWGSGVPSCWAQGSWPAKHVGEGVARLGCADGGDQQQFGVGGRGVTGQLVQLGGG